MTDRFLRITGIYNNSYKYLIPHNLTGRISRVTIEGDGKILGRIVFENLQQENDFKQHFLDTKSSHKLLKFNIHADPELKSVMRKDLDKWIKDMNTTFCTQVSLTSDELIKQVYNKVDEDLNFLNAVRYINREIRWDQIDNFEEIFYETMTALSITDNPVLFDKFKKELYDTYYQMLKK